MADDGTLRIANWIWIVLGVLVAAELAYAGLARDDAQRLMLLGLFLAPPTAYWIVFGMSWRARLSLLAVVLIFGFAISVFLFGFGVQYSVDLGKRIDVKKYVLTLALQSDDSLKIYERLAGIATLYSPDALSEREIRNKILAQLAGTYAPGWRITDLDVDPNAVAEPGRTKVRFAAQHEAYGVGTSRSSALVGRANFELPREVALALRLGELGPDSFSAVIETPSHALMHWDDDMLVNDLPAASSGAERHGLDARSDARSIGFDFVRAGHRNAVTQFFLANTPLQIALYALALLGSILLLLLGIARDAITEERIKPFVVRILRKLKILAPSPPGAPSSA